MLLAQPLAELMYSEGQIHLVWEEIMAYVNSSACFMMFVDDEIVFALFVTVCSPLHQPTPF